jgi:Ca2+/Na+ antiporter
MPIRRLLYLLLAALCVLRLLLIGFVELSPDEAYYTLWSKYMDVSYYSKGPGVAAVIWAGTHLFGVNEFGVRFFSPLLALGTSLLMFHFARRLYGEAVAFWTAITLQVIPIYQAGSVLMTIDPLSIFFWMAAMATFWRALEEEPARPDRWWLGTGALIGAGFLCKWTNAMQLISIVLLLAITPRHRRKLRSPGFIGLIGVFLLFTIPPIAWNEQHDRITYHHLFARGGLDKDLGISLAEFFKFLGSHFGVYSPLIFFAMLVALFVGLRNMQIHFKPRFLVAFTLPIFVLYFLLSFREAGEANWTAPATLSLALLTVAVWYEWSKQLGPVRIYSICALALSAVMGLLLLDLDLIRAVGIPLAYEVDPTARLRGWRSSAELVEKFRGDFEQQHQQPVFLIANKYQTAAALAFYMGSPRPAAPNHPPVYIPESQAIENQFSFWPRYDEMEELSELADETVKHSQAPEEVRRELADKVEKLKHAEKHKSPHVGDAKREVAQLLSRAEPSLPIDESFVEEQGISIFAGRTALYVTDRAEERPPSTVKDGFEKVELIGCFDLNRRGVFLRQLRIFACYNYHGMAL